MASNARRSEALHERLLFQSRSPEDDGWGSPVAGSGVFTTQFEGWAGLRPRIGGEAVTAARLSGQQPFVVTVKYDSQFLNLTTSWRLVDKSNPNRVFNVTSPPADPDGLRQWLEFLAVEGGAPS